MPRNALVVGSTGISGNNLANLLVAEGWSVYGLARRPAERPDVAPVKADLLDVEATRSALGGLGISHVFSALGRGRIRRLRTAASTAPCCAT